MLQRQIMFKQLEELQRQKKLQELNNSKQQTDIYQQSLIHNKQASVVQYGPLINGTPVQDPSRMFMFGNPNLVQGFQNGLPYSQAQNQVLHSTNLSSQPIDGHSFSRFSGVTHESNGEQLDTTSRSCTSDQFNVSYQERNMFGTSFSQGLDMGAQTGNDSQCSTSLDPLEQKFLFDEGDDSVGGFGKMFEDDDKDLGIPSIQSGSWSALMQSAVEETSSTDTGVQEEWSGLTFNDGPNKSNEFDKGCLSSKASDVSMSSVLDRSADLSSMDSNTQTSSHHMLELAHKVDKFKEYKHGTQSAYIGTTPLNEIPITKTANEFTPSTNSSTPRAVDLRLTPSTQRAPVNYSDLSQISQHAATSHLVSLKNQDGQQVFNSTNGANVWVDIPPGGSPSTAYVANKSLEASRHVMNSQGLDYTTGQDESFLGRAEANISSLKQAYISPLNPAYSNPSIRPIPKSERVESDTKISEPTSLVKISSHPPLQDVFQLHRNSSYVQTNLASLSHDGSVNPVIGINSFAVNQLSSANLQHIDVANRDLVVSQSKKRKFSTYELLPWHKEIAQGSSRLQDMRIAELEWAQAANRVPEKLKGETEALGDLPWIVHPKKKIMFTTQLMQVLFRPVPVAILSNDATACYNTVTYYAARLAVGDACSLVIHSHKPFNISDSLPGNNVISKARCGQNLSKIVENLIDQAKKLEDELLRLESGTSFLELRMESQDLDKFAAINRFAKFYTRAQMVAAESASSGGPSTVPKLYAERYVTASQMPRIVPEGRNCISL